MSTNIFPRTDYNVVVCSHRWGKEMTYCDSSDGIPNNNYMPLMLWYMRNNIKAGLFDIVTDNNQMGIAWQLERCGVLNNSLYCTMGVANQKTMDENAVKMRELFKKFLMRYPSTFSYSGADETYYKYTAKYLDGGRDNDYGDFGHPYTFYGYSFDNNQLLGSLEVPEGYGERTGYNRYNELKHFMSIRWVNEATTGKKKYNHDYTVAQCIQKVIDDVVTTYGNHGFYNAFCHWHDLGGSYDVSKLQYKDYIDALGNVEINNVGVSKNIHFCGFDEAIEYMVARMMLKKIACYTPIGNPSEVHIVGYFNNDVSPAFRMDCLNTPLTIQVNLTGTPLAGSSITSSYGNVVSKGNNVYLVELPAPRSGNISGIILSKVEGDDYVVTDKPTITTSQNGDIITFAETNHLASVCHFCVFRKGTSQTEDNASIIGYHHNVSNVQVTKESGYVYAVGVCANYGNGHYVVSNVSNWV